MREALKTKKIKGSTLVHVRRQDYLSLNEELNINYYELAIKEAARLIEDFNFSIFTEILNGFLRMKFLNMPILFISNK